MALQDGAEQLPFQGVRVLDLSRTIAGQFMARLLADHGASVTHLRRADCTHVGSALFLHLNHNKIIEFLPDDDVPGVIRQCGADLDVVVVSDHGEAELAAESAPHALVAVATDFADEGPYRHWNGCELIHQALSGSMFYTGSAGGTPLYGVGDRASYAAGLFLYLSLVARLRNRRRAGIGDVVRVTVHEAAAAMEQNFSAQWAYSKTIAQRGELNRPKARIRCADGWMMVFAMEGRLPELLAAVGADDLATSPPFSSWQQFMGNLRDAFAQIAERVRERSQNSLLDAAVRHRVVMSPVRTPRELRHDSQLLARGFWRELQFEGKQRLVLGPMWRPAGYEPRAVISKGQRPGPHDILGSTKTADESSSSSAEQTRPLAGVRVVDFTTAWSGPMAARILALLGAEVIKIESAERLDSWRGPASRGTTQSAFYPDSDPGAHPYNRHAWFNAQNLGKKSVLLDIKSSAGRAQALQLCRTSDVVVTNFTPGTMDRLGLGFEELRLVNPNVVMVEMSGFGATGPLREHRAYGQTMEAMAGITALIGDDESGPLGSGSAYVDPMGGLAGAAAALTSLVHRDRTGRAQYVEVAQREAAMHWIGEIILNAIESGVDPQPIGNARPTVFPHDAFPCRGEDEWIAIAIHNTAQWSALCAEIGWSDWMDDATLRNAAGRQARAKEITQRLSEFTEANDKAALAERLQRAGVPSAPVQNGKDLFSDPQLRHRGWFTRLAHPEAGVHEYAGLPLEAAGRPLHPTSAAPLLGQHTDLLEENSNLRFTPRNGGIV